MIKEMGLAWIVVEDFRKAVQFYTETVGLKICEVHEHYGWAELRAEKGNFRLGIAQKNEHDGMLPGSNAVLTLTVEDLDKAKQQMLSKGARLVGEVMEVPGQVKMQMVLDLDGNRFQLVELLEKE